jgi:MYXO-CTERM domain-containing protein
VGWALSSECNGADSCNGSGTCLTNYLADGTSCSMGECHAGFCSMILTDAGSDASTDAGDAGHAMRDAGQLQDAQATDGAADAQAAGGTAGTGGSAFNLGGRGGSAGHGGSAGLGVGGSVNHVPDASTNNQPDAGGTTVGTPKGCDCSLPGKEQRSPLGMWAALGLMGVVVLRRRKSA